METARLVQGSWAPRTLQMFEVGNRQFKQFRIEINSPSPDGPATDLEVNRFISHLSLSKKAPATINSYVCAISTWHKTKKWDDPCTSYMVKRALRGAGRGNSTPDARQPITPGILEKIMKATISICSSKYEASLFKCIFSLAFFGLFRIGELVCNNKRQPQIKVLHLKDIAFKEESMKVTVRYSKTDQTGKSSSTILKGNKESPLCPVQAMKEYITMRGLHAGPLFCHTNGFFLSRFQFNKVLELALQFCKEGTNNIKSHSFRIGGATNAMSKGIPYEQVKEMGRWQSDAAKKYIRIPTTDISKLL